MSRTQTIPEFFTDCDVFITGGSGFIGKVLIEKLLRSCPNVRNIFMLIRCKKGKTVEERVKILTSDVLFDKLRQSKAFDKIVPIYGDCTKLKLGISEADYERMKNVSVIYHVAASVRFDDNLKDAIMMNARSTSEVMNFALTLKSLKALVHVSTAYSNPFVYDVEEKV